jgi:hypothetical protein
MGHYGASGINGIRALPIGEARMFDIVKREHVLCWCESAVWDVFGKHKPLVRKDRGLVFLFGPVALSGGHRS